MDDTRSEWPYTPVQTQTYSTSSEPAEQEEGPTQEGFALSHPGQTARTALEQVQQRAGEAVDQLKAQAGDTAVQLKNQAGSTVERLKTQAGDQLDTQIVQAGVNLGTVAEAVNTLGNQLRQGNQALLASYAERVAGHVDQMATYLRQSDSSKMLHDLEDFAHREPALFLAGAFALGLLGTRFLKSSSGDVNSGGTADEPPPEVRQLYREQ